MTTPGSSATAPASTGPEAQAGVRLDQLGAASVIGDGEVDHLELASAHEAQETGFERRPQVPLELPRGVGDRRRGDFELAPPSTQDMAQTAWSASSASASASSTPVSTTVIVVPGTAQASLGLLVARSITREFGKTDT